MDITTTNGGKRRRGVIRGVRRKGKGKVVRVRGS